MTGPNGEVAHLSCRGRGPLARDGAARGSRRSPKLAPYDHAVPLRSLLAIAAGLCLWLAQPGPQIWPLALVGVAGLAYATAGVDRLRDGFLLGVLTGLAAFVPTLKWSGIYVGPMPWLALSASQAVYVGFLGIALALLQRDGRVRVLLGAASWVAMEWARSTTPFGGFPWARLAFSQAESPLVHLASVAGAPGVTFVVAVIGGALALAVQRWQARRWGAGLVPVAAAGALVLVSIPWPTPTDGKPLTVAAIQGNVPAPGLDFNAERRAVLDNHAGLTRQVASDAAAGRGPSPDVVFWPENSSDIDPLRNPDAQQVITDAVRAAGVPTVVGAVLQEPAPNVSNTSLLYGPDGQLLDRYVKQHPVPFAEYIPYRSFFRMFTDKVDLVRNDFTAGTESTVFQIPTRSGTVPTAPVICFEVAYDSLVRQPVQDGAQLLLVPTNNATFGYSDESVQQLAISKLRAIETGRSVVHISTVGVSALIRPDGTVTQQSGLFTRDALVDDVTLRTEQTLATKVGRIPEVALSVFAALGMLVAWRSRRASRVPSRASRSARPGSDEKEADDRS